MLRSSGITDIVDDSVRANLKGADKTTDLNFITDKDVVYLDASSNPDELNTKCSGKLDLPNKWPFKEGDKFYNCGT